MAAIWVEVYDNEGGTFNAVLVNNEAALAALLEEAGYEQRWIHPDDAAHWQDGGVMYTDPNHTRGFIRVFVPAEEEP